MRMSPEACLIGVAGLALGIFLGPAISVRTEPAHARAQAASVTAPSISSEPTSTLSLAASIEAPAKLERDYGSKVQVKGPGTLSRASVLVLAERCAPSEPETVLAAIVREESGHHPLKIRVNGARSQVYEPSTVADASSLAHRLIAGGANVDLGLAQINSGNLHWLGLSIEDAFDPCRNLAAGAAVLADGYRRAITSRLSDRSLLQTAYSVYNTGDPTKGFQNGYVAKVERRR